jgi:ADP-ribose pyrophosphatase
VAYKKISSEVAYRGRSFVVNHDVLQTPQGKQTTYDIVVHIGAVAMVAIDSSGRLLLVRQYRHSTGKYLLELPAGTLEPGEPVEQTAQRELREEVGMAAATLTLLVNFFLAPGYSTERMWIFIAQNLTPEKLEGDEDEDLEIVRMTWEECFAAIQNGEIEDAKTILGLYLARERLNPE